MAFYRDVLGAAEELQIHGDNDEKVTILDVERATLEISNPAQVYVIDRVEVGRGSGLTSASHSKSLTRAE